ncbi:flagellar hook-length control protein FliK [Ferrimonas sp. YFM]|uniref:flagellar hook-length control protein FliK n=1 Tax=Ferrimonas sp. YFM TaxID=3028878 RepID=UPI0025741445|nr:flagellar hook-length control protein FliK [Ferrimonas sp. YFM]BDY04032.1 hypothetical protein F0521_10730 [Ferrimonas sp. YFM]
MEARLQVTQTPSVLSTAPTSKGSSDDGFEAALANATEAGQSPLSQPQATDEQPDEISGASQEVSEAENAEAPAGSSEAKGAADAQVTPQGEEQQQTQAEGKGPLLTQVVPTEDAGDEQAAASEPRDPFAAIEPKVATQADPERQQSAPGNTQGSGVPAPEEVEPGTLTAATETEQVAAKAAQAGGEGKQPPMDRVDPIKGHPTADSEHPKAEAPGQGVAAQAKPRRGASEQGLESRSGIAAVASVKSDAAPSVEPEGEGLQDKVAEHKAVGQLPAEKPVDTKAEGQPDQAKTEASPFAVLKQSDGELVEGEELAAASDSPRAVTKKALAEALGAQPGGKPETPQAADGKDSPKTGAKEGPRALSGSELLAQLQGSREVQSKLEGEPQPQKLDAATRQAQGDTGAMSQAPVSQKLAGEKLDPELAKEVNALQGAQAKAESGLRTAQGTAEMTLQPQLPEAVPVAATTEQGEGLELDTAHRLQHGRTPEAARPAQAEAQQAALRQPVAAERMAPELRERMMMMINSRTNQAEIRLDPPELGALQIKIQMNGDQAQVQLHTQQAQTREMVEQALPRLREMLAQQGITLADTQVSHGGSGQAGAQEGDGSGDGSGSGADGMVEASDEALVTVQQMTGRNADGGIDYYA